MNRASKNAQRIAEQLAGHPEVARVEMWQSIVMSTAAKSRDISGFVT
jgi:hypothetical protein